MSDSCPSAIADAEEDDDVELLTPVSVQNVTHEDTSVNDNKNEMETSLNPHVTPQPGTSASFKAKRKLDCTSPPDQQLESVSKKLKEDQIELSTDEPSTPTPACHQIFTIELVMLEILKNLPNDQLVLCREISSEFYSLATQLLRRRRSFQIAFTFDWTTSSYKTWKFRPNSDAHNFTLTNFTKFLKTCPNFPCQTFVFNSGTLSSEDLQEFFNSHGPHIKKLVLDIFSPPTNNADEEDAMEAPMSTDYPPVSMLKSLLVDQLPNLESVHLKGAPSEWKIHLQQLFPQSDTFIHNLKFLKLSTSLPDQLFSDLLSASVNLQEISLCTNIRPLLQANKFHMVKALVWVPTSEEVTAISESEFNSLPTKGSQLKTLALSLVQTTEDVELWPTLSKLFQRILEAAANTLDIFVSGTSIGFLRQLRVPQLTKVRKIQIGMLDMPPLLVQGAYTKKVFPPGFQFTASFPNVSVFYLCLNQLTRMETWSDYFDDNLVPVPSVKELHFEKTKYLPVGWITHFAQLFPNTELLFVKTQMFNFSDAAGSGLWSFLRLKSLVCEVNVNCRENNYPALDSAFTGYSTGTVVMIQEFVGDGSQTAVTETCRESPSILDLKALETLRLIFVDDAEEVRAHYPLIMTPVTGEHAFRKCPFLKVFLEYRVSQPANLTPLKSALSPLLPYINSQPTSDA